MTPQLGRIKKRSDFLRAARAGRKWATAGLVLQAFDRRPAGSGPANDDLCPDSGVEDLRVGFTASRKVGNAVARNRARRRLKALSRELLPSHGRPGTDYVLIARQATLERPYAGLRADLETALEKIERRRGGRPADRRERQGRERQG